MNNQVPPPPADPYLKKLADNLLPKHYRQLDGYMGRYWLKKSDKDQTIPSIRLHHIMRSDHARALHDHPFDNTSIILLGGYWEVKPGEYQRAIEANNVWDDDRLLELHYTIASTPGRAVSRRLKDDWEYNGVYWRGMFDVVHRKAPELHRLVVPQGCSAWTIFKTSAKTREWGFQDPVDGWVHHDSYLEKLGRQV